MTSKSKSSPRPLAPVGSHLQVSIEKRGPISTEDIKRVVGLIDASGVGMVLSVGTGGFFGISLVVEQGVPDSNGGKFVVARQESPMPLSWEDEGELIGWVRKCLVLRLTHELDEHIYVAGVRVFDPHRAPREKPADFLKYDVMEKF